MPDNRSFLIALVIGLAIVPTTRALAPPTPEDQHVILVSWATGSYSVEASAFGPHAFSLHVYWIDGAGSHSRESEFGPGVGSQQTSAGATTYAAMGSVGPGLGEIVVCLLKDGARVDCEGSA